MALQSEFQSDKIGVAKWLALATRITVLPISAVNRAIEISLGAFAYSVGHLANRAALGTCDRIGGVAAGVSRVAAELAVGASIETAKQSPAATYVFGYSGRTAYARDVSRGGWKRASDQ